MITIENLKHFVAVVGQNGINRAAEHMFISPSSLTRSIQIIETELDQKLFDRVGRTIQLNKRGKDFYDETLEVLGKFDGLLSNKALATPELRGHYMLGASHFLCQEILGKKLGLQSPKYKNTTFGIYSFDSSVLMRKIHLGEIDMGISFGLTPSESIDTHLLSKGQMYLCGRKKHPLSNAPFSEVRKHLSEYPAIMHRPVESIERCDNHPVYKEHGITPSIQLYWDSDFFALEMMAHSNSWSLMPDVVIESDPRIVKFNHPKNWSAPYDIRLFWNKRKSNEVLKNAILQDLTA